MFLPIITRNSPPQDDLYDNFLHTDQFQHGNPVHIPRRYNDLVMWLFWAVLLCVPLFWLLAGLFMAGTLLQQAAFLAGIVLGNRLA